MPPAELGDTPVERAVAWLIEVWGQLTEDEVRERFTPRFLQAVPPAHVVDFIAGTGEPVGEMRIEEIRLDSPFALKAIVSDDEGRLELRARVEEQPPHRFDGLRITAPDERIDDWDALLARLREHDRCESALEPWVAEWIEKSRDERQIPGLVAGIVRDGSLAHRQALGVGDLDAPAPLSADDVFRAGSISKVITALASMRLVDEAALSLDDPVSEHLRAFTLVSHERDDPPITIRHVLTHTAGLPRHQGHLDAGSLEEMVGGELRAIAPPGAANVYSNIGFGMLGQLIADVSGMSYADYVAGKLFAPLGMARTSSAPDGSAASVRGYSVRDGAFEGAPDQRVVEEGAGALCSTVEDLATLAAAVCDGDERLCSRASLAEALSPQDGPIPGAGPTQGLGFVLWETTGHRVVWHNGGLLGWKSAWYVAPEARTAVILMATRLEAPLDDLARALMTELLG